MNAKNKNIACVLLFFLTFFSMSNYAQQVNKQALTTQDITIKNAYIRETLPGNQVSSAYMTLINNSDKEITLVSISSTISPRIEIHAHIMENDMMKMKKLDAISIKANAQVWLQPYGLHLMMFDLQQGLKEGQTVTLVLHFTHAKNITVNIPIRSIKTKFIKHKAH